MKFKAITFSALFLTIGFSGISQELPVASSKATVKQRIGLTDVEITYSRPNVKKRVIFGELVPFDKIWRLGANEATTFETSSEIHFDSDRKLPAGKYALFATPGKDSWVLHFNKTHDQWGTYGHKKEEDVLIVNVGISEPTHLEESMSIRFTNVTTDRGNLIIEWAKTKIVVPFTVPTKKMALKNIENAISEGKDLDKVYTNAAEYYSEQLNDNETALKYANKSIKEKETIQGYFTKAVILHSMGDKENAIQNAKAAAKIATETKKESWAGYINKTIEEWKK